MSKTDNTRRFPGAKSPRPDHYECRRKEALERNTAWASLTHYAQLKELDRRLGNDTGARRQRARIALAATKPAQVKAPSGPTVKPEAKAKETAKARHKRGA